LRHSCGTLAIVANSLDWVPDGANWKFVPDNKLYVIDLTSNPPVLIDTVAIGKQPSGLSINRTGDLALVANRADNSISVLSIQGKQVKLIDTVPMGEMVAAVVFTPDGKRALAAKFPGHKVAFLDVDGQQVTYNKRDVSVGLWPYNLAVSADGKFALTGDNGNAGRSDGNVDTVTVIDIEANPPRVIDKVVVGDGPEGFAVSRRRPQIAWDADQRQVVGFEHGDQRSLRVAAVRDLDLRAGRSCASLRR